MTTELIKKEEVRVPAPQITPERANTSLAIKIKGGS
jgi:hypothetical protein